MGEILCFSWYHDIRNLFNSIVATCHDDSQVGVHCASVKSCNNVVIRVESGLDDPDYLDHWVHFFGESSEFHP